MTINVISKMIILEDYKDIGSRTETWERWLNIKDAKRLRDELDKAIQEIMDKKVTLIFGHSMCFPCQDAKAKADAEFKASGKPYRYLNLDDDVLNGPSGVGILALALNFGIVVKDGNTVLLPKIFEVDESELDILK